MGPGGHEGISPKPNIAKQTPGSDSDDVLAKLQFSSITCLMYRALTKNRKTHKRFHFGAELDSGNIF